MVTVSRTVLGVPRFRFCLYVVAMCEIGTYEPEVSNGQIENWVLTQITDQLTTAAPRDKFILHPLPGNSIRCGPRKTVLFSLKLPAG